MTDTIFSLDELNEDRNASEEDRDLCLFFVASWPEHIKATEYQKRADANQEIIDLIDAELKRRAEAIP